MDAQEVPPEYEEQPLSCVCDIQNMLDEMLCHVLWDDSALAGTLDQMTC